MKFFAISLSFLALLLALTIVLGCFKGFSSLVIVGIVLVAISMVATIIIYLMNLKAMKNKSDKNPNNHEDKKN